jgi:thymidylate synthase (FAD)
MMKIDLLNCVDGEPGFVRLVKCSGTDLDVVRAARVSYDCDWRTGENEGADRRLIRYLLKNRHTSPFEHVNITFEIKAPIFVFRQWHRHRTWSYNEISARYTELDEGFYVPVPEHITTQSVDNKQMRTKIQHPSSFYISGIVQAACKQSVADYRVLLEMGAPRELARGVLPLNAYSRMFATVDLHNFMGFLRLRLHEHSQYEIRVYAEAMSKLVSEQVPVTMEEFLTLGVN